MSVDLIDALDQYRYSCYHKKFKDNSNSIFKKREKNQNKT